MMPEITIANRQRSLRPNRARLRRTLSSILERRGRGGALSVALVDDAEIRRVHREFLGDDRATDVISFRYREPPGKVGSRKSEVGSESRDFFGEIVFSTVIPRDAAVSEAPSHGRSVIDYAPRSRGARAYVELCQEVMERV